jgi:hypothetical protein
MIKISHIINSPEFLSRIPKEALEARDSGMLHKVAAARVGELDFNLKTAVYHLAKKAYLNRQEWSIIGDSIDSLSKLKE